LSRLPLSDNNIAARCASGALILDIYRFGDAQIQEDSLVNKCIELHNRGRINLLSLIDTPQFESLEGPRFFVVQHFFSSAIPLLEAPVDQMLCTVDILVEKGGSDLAAGSPNDALRLWFKKRLERAEQVVEMANAGDERASRLLAFAIEALEDINLARSIITRYSDKRRVSGITALGCIKSPGARQAKLSANLLLPYITSQHDDETRCNSLICVFKVCEQFPSLFAKYVPSAIESVTKVPSDATRFALAKAIWLFHKVFDHN
jgi:hypothetical protein